MPKGLSRYFVRLVPFGSFSGLAVVAATSSEPSYLLAGLLKCARCGELLV